MEQVIQNKGGFLNFIPVLVTPLPVVSSQLIKPEHRVGKRPQPTIADDVQRDKRETIEDRKVRGKL